MSAPAGAPVGSADGWDDLVSCALLGTDRRPPAPAGLPDPVRSVLAGTGTPRDPATALLDAAALMALYRRAGAAPLPRRRPMTPAPADDRRTPSAAATARLSALLEELGAGPERSEPGRAAGRTAAARDAAAPLTLAWLSCAAAAGFSAAPRHLPALLDLAARRPAFSAAVPGVLGARGRWLAGLRAEWSSVLDRLAGSDPDTSVAPDDPDSSDASDVWTRGTSAQRRSWLLHRRAVDPAAGREALLALDWAGERAEDRLAFVDALATGLSEADEAVLERARTDRRHDVRVRAEQLLIRLPTSAHARQLTAAALLCLRVERQRLRRTLVVTLPDDEAAAGPAITLPPRPAGVGPAQWLLRHLLSTTPPSRWQEHLGVDTPAALLTLPVADAFADLVHAAWTQATITHRDLAWVRALLPVVPGHQRPGMLSVLPDAERLATAAAVVRRHEPRTSQANGDQLPLHALLVACPAPWGAPLDDAVLTWLAKPRGAHTVDDAQVAALARFALPATPEVVQALRTAAASAAADAADAGPATTPRPGTWHAALTDLAHVVGERREIAEELR